MANLTTSRVRDYLDELDRALRALRELPRARRQEIVQDIRAHIDAALADTPAPSDADVERVLADLGPPLEIAEAALAEAAPDETRPTPERLAWRDIAAVTLLLVGGFVLVLGWLVGLVLLWTSTTWRTRDKLVGTLLVPGGLLVPALLFGLAAGNSSGSDGSGGPPAVVTVLLLVLTVGGPLFTTFWLIDRARRPGT